MPESPPVTKATRPDSFPVPAYERISSCGSGVISDSTPGRSCCCGGNSFSSDPMPRRLPGRGPALTVAAPPESRRPREVVLAAVERAVLAQRVVAHDDGAGADARERAAARVGHRPLRATRRGGGVAPARAEVALDVREQAAPSVARGRSRA